MEQPERVTLSGEIRDSGTNQPVVMADVTLGTELVHTGRDGKFTISAIKGNNKLVVSRTGYETLRVDVPLSANGTRTFQLVSHPTARVVAANNKTYLLDDDSIEFGYANPFQGFHRTADLKVCSAGGETTSLKRSDISRIDGPVSTGTQSGCCERPLTKVFITLDNGQRSDYLLADSCLGYPLLVFGRNHLTWELEAVQLAEVQEVVIP